MAHMLDPTAGFLNEEDIYNFFSKLWFILNDTEYQYFPVVRWIKNGDTFRICDADKFYKEVCPMIWKGCTREYFVYLVFACNFELVNSGFLDFRNRNRDFVEEYYERLKNIKPRKPVLTLRVFLDLSKNSSTEIVNHKIHIHKISSTSGKSFPSDAGVSEQGNAEENSNQLLGCSGKAYQLKNSASELKKNYGNSNQPSYGRKYPYNPSNLIRVRASTSKNIDKNENPLSCPSGKVPPTKIKSSKLKNEKEISNKLSGNNFPSVNVSAQENTKEDSDIIFLGQYSLSVDEGYSPQNTCEKSNEQLGPILEKDISSEVEAPSVEKNTDESSNRQRSFTSEKDTSSDFGASAPYATIVSHAWNRNPLAEKMSQEDIYSFLKKLWDIISDSEYQYFPLVRWMETGRSFRIVDLAKFYEEVCPLLCEGCTSDYFKYLLLGCGFKSFSNDFLNYCHDDFLEDDSEKLKEIRPMTCLLTPRAFLKLLGDLNAEK